MRSIRRRKSVVILRSEVSGLGSQSQLTRVLAKLVATGQLIRVGHGIYAKTRINRYTGRPAPAAELEEQVRRGTVEGARRGAVVATGA